MENDGIKQTHYVAPEGHPVKTMKIESHDVDTGYVVINADDFDPEKHVEFSHSKKTKDEGAKEKEQPAPKAK